MHRSKRFSKLRANVYRASQIHALFLLKTDFVFSACIREGGLARLPRSRLEQPGWLTSYRRAPRKPDEYSLSLSISAASGGVVNTVAPPVTTGHPTTQSNQRK